MGALQGPWRRHQQRIIARCHTGPAARGAFASALAALRETVPAAVACHGAVDPETWLPVTHADDRAARASCLGALWHNEYLTPDVNKLRLLAHRPTPVGVLSEATAGELWRSPRYEAILRPIGVQHELRAALMADRAAWGYLTLLRPADRPDFSAAEVALVAAVAPHLAEAQRRDQLSAAVASPQASPQASSQVVRTPGVVLLNEQDDVQGTTGEAEDLLEDLGRAVTEGQPLPEVIYLVAAAARAAAQRRLEPGIVPRGRLRTPSGQWLAVHGAVVRGAHDLQQVAITIEPARSSEVAALLVKAYDFTAREQQVVLLVLRGLSTGEIARQLWVSPYTVQDHLKAIFDKASVRSRRELVAEVFYRHYPGWT